MNLKTVLVMTVPMRCIMVTLYIFQIIKKKQEFLIEENKKMITDIGVLSGSDRIESIAENELGMRKAESDEIVRVNLGAGK